MNDSNTNGNTHSNTNAHSGVSRPTLRPAWQNRPAPTRPAPPVGRPAKDTRMRTLSKRSHAVSGEEREARRTRMLDYLQMVRIATRRDLDRVAGYVPGTSHNYTLEGLYKRRLIDRIENIDSGQTLYTITTRGESFATCPTEQTPLSTFDWQNSAQQEHRLGVAALTSVLLSPTPLNGMLWEGDDRMREALLEGTYVLLGEPLINEDWAKHFGKKRLPGHEKVGSVGYRPEALFGPMPRAEMYHEARFYMIPPYLWDERSQKELPIIVLYPQGGGEALAPGPGVRIMERHPADAVLAPNTMQLHDAVALEIERYCKGGADYVSTMARYGSELGRERFRKVVWACRNEQILNAVKGAAEKTNTSDMLIAFVYDTGRRNGSFLQGTEFRAV